MASAAEWKQLTDAEYWLLAVLKEEKNYPYPTSITVNYDIIRINKGNESFMALFPFVVL